MTELNKTITDIENTLQDARGELSVFENKFPTDSPQHELIVELLERLDEASDPNNIEADIRETPEVYDVETEAVLVQDIVEGDIVLQFGNPAEVTRVDGWNTPSPTGGYREVELTLTPWKTEAFTTTHTAGAKLLCTVRDRGE